MPILKKKEAYKHFGGSIYSVGGRLYVLSYLPACGEGVAIDDAVVIDVVFFVGRRRWRRQVLFQLSFAALADSGQSAHAPLDFGIQGRTALHGFPGNKAVKKT